MFRNLSVGTRLTLIITTLFSIILVVITFIETRSSDTALRNQTLTRFASKSQAVIDNLNLEFKRIEDNMEAFASAISNMGDVENSEALRSRIADFVNSDNDQMAVRFSVMRPDGKVGVFEMTNPLIPRNNDWRVYSTANQIPDDPRFNIAKDTNAIYWFEQDETFYDEERQSSITIVAPYSLNGVVAGIIWVDIPQSRFESKITTLLNDQGLLSDTIDGYATLVDENGKLITLHNLSIRNRQLTEDINTIIQATSDTSGQPEEFFDPITEQNSFVSVRSFKYNAWKFLVTLPVAEVPVVPSGVLGPIAIISILGALVLVWVINGFTRGAIGEPLRRLGTSAQEIGAGDFRYYIAYRDRRDEIGRVAQALEDMRVSLEHSYDELSRWGRTLERRVVERTKELDVARQQAQESANELQAIYTESLVVVNETQLKPMLDALTTRLPALLDSTYAAVWLLSEERDKLQLVATNSDKQREGSVIRMGEGIVGQSLQQAKAILLDDYKSYPYNIAVPGFGADAPFDRAMSVPLIYVGRPIGALIVGRPQNSRPYTEDDQRLLTLFANLISPTVRNAQLFVMMNSAVSEAERANQVKTRFLASVTHELRTPLNLIINNMDFMRIGAFGEVNKEQVSRLGQTVRSAEHLLYLINDLLDVSKIEAGEMQLFIQDNDIEVMLDDSIDNTVAFMEKIDGKTDAVEFVVDIEEDLPKIPMDVRRVRQVLTNLLTNAVKFTDKGTVSLMVRKNEHGVEFNVTDTGMGILPEEADKLFQAFERTNNAKSQNIEGTGLGLPISKFLVEQHGGTLTFKSELNKGTTFSFTLPYKQQSATDSGVFRRSDPAISAMLSSKTQL